ncbi:hypothetical protein GCM10023224_41070 [Streptomonospora halophila]|uniref:DUF998 domain-containing protein n=1 Tax=Streptomonospora halophila TaxID=427369 RepID=A0ABP9H0N3_9ACTN
MAAAAWTAPYVASKVHYALDGRLGVTGGPRVPESGYAAYGPGEAAAAQWANAGVGAAALLLFAAGALPAVRRAPRWLPALPVGAAALVAAAGAIGMTGRAIATDAGGALFGAYCLVWTVLALGVLRELLLGGRRRKG